MRKVFAIAAILVVLGTSCSKSTTTPTGTTTQPPVTLSGKVNVHATKDLSTGSVSTVEIEADNDGSDFYFDPTFIKATPGSAITVDLKNAGNVAHTFTIDAPATDTQIEPGKTAEAKFTLPASGLVKFYCRFHGGSGMQGAFYFVAGQTEGATSPEPVTSY